MSTCCGRCSGSGTAVAHGKSEPPVIRRPFLVALLIAVLGAACTDSGQPSAKSSSESFSVCAEHRELDQVALIVADDARQEAHVFKGNLCSRDFTDLSGANPVIDVAAVRDRVIVSYVKDVSTLALLEHGSVLAIPRLGMPTGHSPTLNSTADLSFVQNLADGRGFALIKANLDGSAGPTTMFEDHGATLAKPIWLHNGHVAVVRQPLEPPSAPATLIEVSPDGTKTDVLTDDSIVTVDGDGDGAYAWSPSVDRGWKVSWRRSGETQVFTQNDWRVLAWVPRSTVILVRNEDGSVGLLDTAASTSAVEPVPFLEQLGSIRAVAWANP